ncbi:fatty acid binding protein 1-B.1-like [Anoplophora glabripennis]|uniref:fatty acid binding protein 1-B.1-like n=1 Tax=Anoplophora glabripennis TaxID=217634 RepID=UPI00087504FC|nr:fatty acid binding protein 1-B.1-like [Anoplophora glabripennis]XP_018570589.1 fatty acid binding protein 1-B.1-like [Anoplophora glabripennis]
MSKLVGKYQLAENKNFYEFLLELGVPEDKAKGAKEIKGTIEVKVDGNKVTLVNDSPPHVTDFIIGQEVEEKITDETVLKSTASLNGNVLTISSIKDGKPSGNRTLTFSDSGLEMVIKDSKDGKPLSATRIYKRI